MNEFVIRDNFHIYISQFPIEQIAIVIQENIFSIAQYLPLPKDAFDKHFF